MLHWALFTLGGSEGDEAAEIHHRVILTEQCNIKFSFLHDFHFLNIELGPVYTEFQPQCYDSTPTMLTILLWWKTMVSLQNEVVTLNHRTFSLWSNSIVFNWNSVASVIATLVQTPLSYAVDLVQWSFFTPGNHVRASVMYRVRASFILLHLVSNFLVASLGITRW